MAGSAHTTPPPHSQPPSTRRVVRTRRGQSEGDADRFPIIVLSLCAIGILVGAAWLMVDRPEPSATTGAIDDFTTTAGRGGIAFGQQPADATVAVDTILNTSAAAMGEVTSVEFELDRQGAPIYIDQFESIALDHLIGQFEIPATAHAAIEVTIDGTNTTRIGAIAADDEVWVSNPVTGDFETLPPGYDIDPSRFFDPTGGWQPLMSHLEGAQLVGIEQRDGFDQYRVAATAPAADVANITVGLIHDEPVAVTIWIDPGTSLVTAAEFDTGPDDATTEWRLQLGDYGADFTIQPPPGQAGEVSE